MQNVNQNTIFEIAGNLLVTCVFRSLSFRADTYRKQLKAHYKSRCDEECVSWCRLYSVQICTNKAKL